MNINKRNKKIYELCYRSNLSYRKIGDSQNPPISRQRVEQIYKSYAKKNNLRIKNRSLGNKKNNTTYNPFLAFIRITTNKCPMCGSKLYWWSFDKVYCTECNWKERIE